MSVRVTPSRTRSTSENGDIDIIAAVVSLPLLFLVLLVVLDLARVPLARQRMQNALSQGVYKLFSEWKCSDPSGGPPPADDDPHCLYQFRGNTLSEYGTDPLTPAAYNFCGTIMNIPTDSSCPGIGLSSGYQQRDRGVLTVQNSRGVTAKASMLIAKHFEEDASGILSPLFLGGKYAVHVALVKLPVADATAPLAVYNFPTDTEPMAHYFYPDEAAMLDVTGEPAYLNDPRTSPQFAFKTAAQLVNGAGMFLAPIGWDFLSPPPLTSIGRLGVSSPPPPTPKALNPRVLVAYLALRVSSIMGSFSLIGGNDPDNPGDYVLVETITKPIERQVMAEAVIQSNVSNPGPIGGP